MAIGVLDEDAGPTGAFLGDNDDRAARDRFFFTTTREVPMDERPDTSGQRRSTPRPDRALVARLYEKIARLHASVQALRRTTEDLEADRQRLLDENRALRRQLTVSTLIEDLDRSLESVDGDETDAVVPPPAERLYQQLPPRFSFPHFFRVADGEHLKTATARRCLIHYLAEGVLVQSGAYLEKTDRSPYGAT
jgi:hypothetical protein